MSKLTIALFIFALAFAPGFALAAEPTTAAATPAVPTAEVTVGVPTKCVAMVGQQLYDASSALVRAAMNPFDPFGVSVPSKAGSQDALKCILDNGLQPPPH